MPNWIGDSIGWLKEIFGDFGQGCLTEPKCSPYINGNYGPTLSVDCTIGHLLKNPQARVILSDLAEQAEQYGTDVSMLEKITLRGLYSFMKVPREVIEDLDQQLIKICND